MPDPTPTKPVEGEKMTGAELIAAERERQITEEGWTPGHDAEHDASELLDAASGYMSAAIWEADAVRLGINDYKHHPIPDNWPWDDGWWKPSDDPIRNLVKAGALIAAEIDRLIR